MYPMPPATTTTPLPVDPATTIAPPVSPTPSWYWPVVIGVGVAVLGGIGWMSYNVKAPIKSNRLRRVRRNAPRRKRSWSGTRGPRLGNIAVEITRDWKNPYFGAVPYLEAMASMDSINDSYGLDSGRSVVAYFLTNASGWRGPKAKSIKAELNAMLRSR